jgi:dephospho-CoA kinase
MADFSPLVLVTGRPCSGKTTVGKILNAEHGAGWIEASGVARNWHNRNRAAAEGEYERQLEAGIVGQVIARQLQAEPNRWHGLTAITGLRYRSEIDALAGLRAVIIVHVVASAKTRFIRNLHRNRIDKVTSWDEWVARECDDDRFDLLRDPLGEEITNDGTLTELAAQIRLLARA